MQKTFSPDVKFDLTVVSAVVRADKPTRALEAKAAPSPNQMNRVLGYLDDGTRVVVAQRPGKGGMDFNKLLGGKVFAVAADGFSPVFEKGEDKKKTNVQKLEDGLPAYSASGFYLLSSKEYPALQLLSGYGLLQEKGERLLLLQEHQLAATCALTLESSLDWELLDWQLAEALSDENNLVAQFDADINKKRKRGVERARQEAEDADEKYAGVDFTELAVSKKDGNPFVALTWASGAEQGAALILREATVQGDKLPVVEYYTADQAVEQFRAGKEGMRIAALLAAGEQVALSFVQGHVMRTSVSFRRKCENVLTGVASSTYGDGVFIQGALKSWCKTLVALMHSQHPNFPSADYDAHHYVAAPRQAEVGMNKGADGKWSPPQVVPYSLHRWLVAQLPQLFKAAA